VEETGVELAREEHRRVGAERRVEEQRGHHADDDVEEGVDRVHPPGLEPPQPTGAVMDAVEAPHRLAGVHPPVQPVGADLGEHEGQRQPRPVGRRARVEQGWVPGREPRRDRLGHERVDRDQAEERGDAGAPRAAPEAPLERRDRDGRQREEAPGAPGGAEDQPEHR